MVSVIATGSHQDDFGAFEPPLVNYHGRETGKQGD